MAPTLGLSDHRNRLYSVSFGRWLSTDSLVDAQVDEGPNLYSYVANSPISFLDFTGKGKGGKQNLSTEYDGQTYNKRSPADAVKKALDAAKNSGASANCIKALKAIFKVIKRGGSMMYYLELLNQSMEPTYENVDPNYPTGA